MTYPKICSITPEEYQEAIVELSTKYPIFGTDKALTTYSLGLGEETGEALGLLKRYFRGDESVNTPNFKEELTKELGDVTAYLVLIANMFEIDFQTVLNQNVAKLKSRIERNTHLGTGDNR